MQVAVEAEPLASALTVRGGQLEVENGSRSAIVHATCQLLVNCKILVKSNVVPGPNGRLV